MDTLYSLHCGRVGHSHGYHRYVFYCTPYHTSDVTLVPEGGGGGGGGNIKDSHSCIEGHLLDTCACNTNDVHNF